MSDNIEHVCIHCGSNDLSYSDDKQGFGVGKAVAGALVFGPLGLVAGTINSNRRHVHVRCNKCFKVFTADQMVKTEKKAAKKLVTEKKQTQTSASMSTPNVIATGAFLALVLAGLSYIFIDSWGFAVRFVPLCALCTWGVFNARKDAREKLVREQEAASTQPSP